MSTIKNRDSVISDSFHIDHNFGEGFTLKIIEVNPSSQEKILFEAEVSQGFRMKLKATITDNQNQIP